MVQASSKGHPHTHGLTLLLVADFNNNKGDIIFLFQGMTETIQFIDDRL
jgi:hypothetical protein